MGGREACSQGFRGSRPETYHGFRFHHSACITESLNAAIDTIDHCILVDRLENLFGVSDLALIPIGKKTVSYYNNAFKTF